MSMNTDVAAYFARIGYEGAGAATLETLAALHALHPAAIPFEGLDPLLGRRVLLDPEALQRKLIKEGRGGYCFEHNLLLADILRALGFSVTGLAARVLWTVPEGRITTRGHMLLKVETGGETYLTDVGFGGLTLTAPLRFEPGLEQATPHEPFRLMREGEFFTLEAKVEGAWQPLYRFDQQVQERIDYEVANHYTATHPDSRFHSELIAGRALPDRRLALRNNRLSVYPVNGEAERRVLTTTDELKSALTQDLGITLPDAPNLDAKLDGIIRKGAES